MQSHLCHRKRLIAHLPRKLRPGLFVQVAVPQQHAVKVKNNSLVIHMLIIRLFRRSGRFTAIITSCNYPNCFLPCA